MTPEQYWDGDVLLAKYYREADELRNKKINQQLWLQGMYIYDAVSCLVPVLRAFSKKGTKAKPYPSEPYPLNDGDENKSKKRKEKKTYSKGKAYMEAMMANVNKRFKKEVSADVRCND